MIQSLKIIKKRIRSIESTIKVTQAMEMVSVSKLSSTGNMLEPAAAFSSALENMLRNILAGGGELSHPFFEKRSGGTCILCIVTSDTGLCGSYNMNILHKAEEFMKKRGNEKIQIVPVGRKGFSYFKNRKIPILHTYLGMNGRYIDATAKEILSLFTDVFCWKKADEIYVAYTQFRSGSKCKPTVEKLLGLDRPPASGGVDMILEPGQEKLLEDLLPAYLSCRFRRILLESFKSEHFSRVVAMRQANDNAKELLEALILLRNKVRQASITKEMLEIISSAEALKG